MPIRARLLLLLGWLLAAAPAFAGTHTVTLYADLGNEPATGCTVTTSAGSFAGAELALDTTVVTDTSGAQVARVEQRQCGAGAFGPPQLIDAGSWPAGLGNGDDGTAAIETYLPLSSLGGASVARVGLFSTAEGGGGDAMLAAPGGGPILIELGAVVDIPTLSGALLVLLAVALGLFGWLAAGRGGSPLLVVLLLLVGSTALFAAVVRDGKTGDWAGQPLRGADPAWDAPVNADLRSFYAQVEGPALFLRIDTHFQPDSSGANAAPQVNAGADVLAPINQPPTLTGTVTDDGLPNTPGALTLAWTQVSGEGTATFGSPAAAVTSTSFSAVGTYVLRLTANDGELSASDEVTVFVDMAAENVAPTLDPVPDRTVAPNTTLSLGLVGRDGNPFDALTYALVSGPPGASVAPQGVFAFTPTPAQLGGHSITVQVADPGGLSAQATFQVTVAEGNHPPVLDPLADETTTMGASWTRVVTAGDPDPGDPLTFTLLSGPAGMILTGQQLSWTPAPDQTGAFPVRVEVTDAAGARDEGDFTVSIPLPGAPVAYDDRYEVARGKSLTVPAASGVLANDVEPGGGTLNATRLGDPDKGTVTAFGADGSFTYLAPPAEAPPPPLGVELRADWPVANLVNGPLIGDFDGDGGSDTVVFAQHSRILFLRPDGSVLAFHDGVLPAPNGDCIVDAPPGQGVLADVDDDGKVDLVTLANCKRDYPDGPGIYGAAHRLIAFSYAPPAGEGPGGLAVDWLSPLVASDAAAANDALLYVKLTAARLAPSEPPSILWGVERAPHTASCGTLVPGARDAHCRVVTVHRGSDGAILRRLYDVPANSIGWGFLPISGKSAPIAADLDADGSPEVVYNGTIWDGSGSVRAHLDGLPGPHRPITDAAVADLDGDGAPEILGLSTEWPFGIGYLRAFRADGTLLWHFAVGRSTVQSSLSVADVDRDGSPEALFSVWADLFVIDSRGRLKWLRSFVNGSGTATIAHVSLPARYPVYDLDGDGLPEVIVQDGAHDVVFLRGDNGEEQTRWHAPGRPYGIASFSAQAPTVADLDGDGTAEVLFLLNANDGNTPRVITLRGVTPWRSAPRTYHGRGALGADVAEDGTVPPAPPAFWKDPVTNRFDQPAPRPYTVDPRLHAQTSFPYRASGTRHDSPPATVTIDLAPDNRPPVVTSTPPTSARRSSVGPSTPLTYQITAVDPDLGDVISYQLVLAGCGTPGAASVDATAGLFRYAAAVAEETCIFGVRLSDGQGGNTYHGFAVTFTDETRTVPNLVGRPETLALTMLAAAELAGGRVSRRPSPAPAGEVIAQTPPAGASVLRNSAVDYVVSTGPAPEDRDDDGDGTSESQRDCDDTAPGIHPGAIEIPGNGIDENCDGTERNVAELRIEPGAATRATGEEVAFTATAVYDDGTAGDVTATAAWISSAPGVATLDATGRARALSPGSTGITASFGGVIGSASLAVRNRNAGDQEAPTADITSPSDGSFIANQAQVLGTANDANLLRWELAAAPTGETLFTTIAEGAVAVVDGLLGTFDPTLLLNEVYILRLTVWDTNGNTASDEVAVQVDGNQKVGNFSLNFTDLSIPVSGIPVEIVRTYDSRDKRQGDFGIGWRLQLSTLQISASGVQGEGWRVIKPGQVFGLLPSRPHFVSLALPDGRVEVFDLVIDPSVSPLVPLQTATARYVPRAATLGTLESLDDNELLVLGSQPGEVELVTFGTLATYDPQRFRYRRADGTEVVLTRDGVESWRDASGNTVALGSGGVTHSAGLGITFTRDADGRITRVTDPLERQQSYSYTPAGDLIAHTDPLGNTTRYSYDRRHGLLRIIDPLGRPVVRNEFDDDGRLVMTTSASGRTVSFTHDVNGRTEVVTDVDGATSVMEYDARGNVTRVTDPAGRMTIHAYDAADNRTATTNAEGETTHWTWDARHNLVSETNPLGQATSYTYDPADRLTTVTNPLGQVTRYAYDANGNLIQRTNAAGVVDQRLAYNSRGDLVQATDALNATTTFEVDAFGNRTAIIDFLGHRREVTYDAAGLLTSDTNATGSTVTTELDARGQFVAKTDELGRRATFGYTPTGLLDSVTDPAGRTERQELDAEGRVTARIDALGNCTTLTYGLDSTLAAVTDARGNVTSYVYDVLDRRIEERRPDGSVTRTEYDAVGRVVRTIDPRGASTTYTYDDAGRVVKVTDPLGAETLSVYDSAGRLIQVTDPLGHSTSFAYDATGRQTRTTFPDGTSQQFIYDAAGRRTAVTDELGRTTSFNYDAAGNLVQVTDPLGATTSYTWDGEGNLQSQTDATGAVTSYEYDVNGRLSRIVFPDGFAESRTYDTAGNLATVTDPNGSTIQLEYDAAGRLVAKRLPGGGVVTFTYTATGKPASATDSGGTVGFIYDALDRVTSVTRPQGSLTYSYDPSGNLQEMTTHSSTTVRAIGYSWDPRGHLSAVSENGVALATYAYDPAGRLIRLARANGTVTDYTYDARDRLASVVHRNGSSPLGTFSYTRDAVGDVLAASELAGGSVSYGYDALRRLTRETHRDAGGAALIDLGYTYDAVGNRLTRIDHLTATTTSYVYGPAHRLLAKGSAVMTYDNNGNLLTRTDRKSTRLNSSHNR
jgi:YD repeat-containing protein